MEDVFDETVDELEISRKDYDRENDSIKVQATVEGLEKGKNKTIQLGFDKGYEFAMNYVQKLNIMKGFITVWLREAENKELVLKDIAQLEEQLIQLCEDNLEDGKQNEIQLKYKEAVDLFNRYCPNKEHVLEQ